MKIHNVEQGTTAWFNLRLGKPTASEFTKFMTSKFEFRDSKGVDTYVYEKVAETLLGHALPGGGSFATEQGHLVEPDARRWYEFEKDCELRQVGFIEAEDGKSGCSPDALCGDEYGLEIKCPLPQTQVRYLVEGKLPSDYVTQVHGSLFVTGMKEWRFLSYAKGLPKLVLTVKRDEVIMTKIGVALAQFHTQFNAAMARFKPNTPAK